MEILRFGVRLYTIFLFFCFVCIISSVERLCAYKIQGPLSLEYLQSSVDRNGLWIIFGHSFEEFSISNLIRVHVESL